MFSGVYLIRHLASGKVYVGSSVDVKRRFREHRKMLLLGVHHSPYLQNAWLKHGEAAFEFVFYRWVAPTKKALLIAEQRALDYFFERSYNCSPTAHSRQGDKQSAATKQILREKGLETAATAEGRAHLLNMTRLAHSSSSARTAMLASLRTDSNSLEGRKRRSETARRLHAEGKLGGSSEEMRRRYLCTERAQRKLARLEGCP